MYHDDLMVTGLDNWITGHYGEDQYNGTCTNECCVELDDCPCGYDTELCTEQETDEIEVDEWEKENWDEYD